MTITNGYCTLDEVKHSNVLAIESSDSGADATLEIVIEAVSRLIDDDCRRHFYSDSDTETRYYTPLSSVQLFTDDISSPSSDITIEISTDGTSTFDVTLASTDFIMAPYNAEALNVPYQKIEISNNGQYLFPKGLKKSVKVTSRFGWPSVPKEIQTACILQSARIFKRYSTPLGSESMTALGKQTLSIPSLDNDVQYLISRYKKVVFG